MESIEVAIRVRPFLPFENPTNTTITLDENDDRKIRIGKSLTFFEAYYDKVFFNKSTQDSVYNFIHPGLVRAQQGINCTIMAYGQTGSGKTYTMFGSDWTLNSNENDYIDKKGSIKLDKYKFIHNDFVIEPFAETNGIIPRTIMSLFDNKSDNVIISCSYIQIYNERIYDLLTEEEDKPEKFTTFMKNVTTEKPIKLKALNIRENKTNGIYIEGVTEVQLDNFYDCFNLLKEGERQRKKRQTNKNEMSSRSHTIFIINISKNENDKIIKSKINLCDLAGSEKYNKNEEYKAIHFSEMVNINLSLATLGNVINALVNKSGKESRHIPYRNSKLTQLLQDSLGGNTKTYLLATISPSDDNYEESLSTLKFADRAHSVMSKVNINEIRDLERSNKFDSNTVKKLSNELNELKQILQLRTKRGTLDPMQRELMKLREENYQLKKYLNSNDTMKRLINENIYLKSEIKKLSTSRTQNSPDHICLPLNTNNDYYESGLLSLELPTNRKYESVQYKKRTNNLLLNYESGSQNNKLQKAGRNIINTVNNSASESSKSKQNYLVNYTNDIYSTNSGNSLKDNYNNEIKKANARLKMLDELDYQNKIKTQRLIEDISNKNTKNNNYPSKIRLIKNKY